jgi:N-acetylglucosamine-6-phosphate deacetylase
MKLYANVLTPNGILTDTTLEIDGSGRIAAIDSSSKTSSDFTFPDHLIVPGFIDLHVHGGGGSDFMDGTVEAVRTVARTHAKHGTTALLATTLTATREDIDRSIKAILEVINNPGPDEASIEGIHLEGPYICSKRRGAQPEAPIREPSTDELDHWRRLSGNRIRQITMAPEIPDALPFMRQAAAAGINVSIGHTDASCLEAAAAIYAGASQGTHLFNAMTQLGHRSPGVVGALLADDRVYCEIICDGFHVDPIAVKIAVRAKTTERILLITDAMAGTTMPDGNYELGAKKVIVSNGTAKFADGTLAGSVLTMNEAFCNVMKFTSVSAADASRMASENASHRIGLAKHSGTVEVGKKADLAVMDISNGNVIATIVNGRFVYKA